MLSSERAAQLGRIGAFVLHGSHDPKETTRAARAAAESRFLRQAREAAAARGEELTKDEIRRRAGYLRQAHFARMALLSADKRRTISKRKKDSTTLADAVESSANRRRVNGGYTPDRPTSG